MRRSWWMLAVVVLCICLVVAVALAAGERGRGMMGRRGEMGPGAGPGRGAAAMVGRIAERGALAVTSDGVYVLAANRLLKYDHNLNLLKETQLPMPEMPEPMRQRLGEEGEDFDPTELPLP